MPIPKAKVDVRLQPQCVLHFGGSAAERTSIAEDLLAYASRQLKGTLGLACRRAGGEAGWRTLEGDLRLPGSVPSDAATSTSSTPACRRFEWASDPGARGSLLRFVDLEPLGGRERSSTITIRFESGGYTEAMTGLVRWVIGHLPLTWGVAGWFHISDGDRLDLAWDRIAALSKRHWAALPGDAPSMPFDAMEGIPSVGWLTLVGSEWVRRANLRLGEAAGLAAQGVFLRVDRHGIALAAGSAPETGDIHGGSSLAAYRRVDELLTPLMLQRARPWPGAFRDEDVRQAWMGRFREPEAWLRADVVAP
ncbi:type VI immunity family protein [Roseateles chitosanitabidus]|uniref:type VI immunity family protein n=1 Tax=Roseateles chitosanitabidus TaxID=65048 RepID=UPI00082F3BB5|nr:type VI immunity family protein [Roseateles chitosanitabidus]